MLLFLCFFFFKQKTAYEMRISDWSSDVCSSDLSVSLIKDNPAAAVNRRISIVVLNQRAERRIDEQNASGDSNADVQKLLAPIPGPALQLHHIPGLPVPIR